MNEPSLTVGLVPRRATRMVATHNYPGTALNRPTFPHVGLITKILNFHERKLM